MPTPQQDEYLKTVLNVTIVRPGDAGAPPEDGSAPVDLAAASPDDGSSSSLNPPDSGGQGSADETQADAGADDAHGQAPGDDATTPPGNDSEPADSGQPADGGSGPTKPVGGDGKPVAVPHPVIGNMQNTRAMAVLDKMAPADRENVEGLLRDAKSEDERGYLLKAVASGHSPDEIAAFDKRIQGQDPTWMKDHLSLTGDSHGKGIQQQFSKSCNATTVEAVRGELDPLYALKVHDENPHLGEVDDDDPMKDNPKLATEQKELLESAYHGTATKDASGGKAVARDASGGAGRMGDDLLNDMKDTTGVTYDRERIGKGTTADDAVKSIDDNTANGVPVPISIGDGGRNSTAHMVLVTGSDPGPPRSYSIHDPWSGETVIRTEDDLKNGNLNIATWNKLGAIYKPTVQPVPGAVPTS